MIVIAPRTRGSGVMGCMHHGAIELHVNSVAARDDGVLRSGDPGIAVSAMLARAMALTVSECGLKVESSRGGNGHMPFCL